ncbi:unnamed protein product [Effrenium voratum]|nr:unnamed protein product [Effrenium voratum]
MGGCASQPQDDVATPKGPKRYDVFISHHSSGLDDGEEQFDEFSQQFASWIAEMCDSLNLTTRFDPTNLSRILDERKLKSDVVGSRVLVGIVNRSALLDPNGMHQELQWADAANIPIVPFYNGDHHPPEEYSSWRDEFRFLKRAPVAYYRKTHLRVKDSLIVCLQEALQDSYKASGIHMPPALSDLLDRQADRAQQRQRKAMRAATLPASMSSNGTGKGGKAALSEHSPDDSPDKRFRFRDEDVDDERNTGGVGRLLKTLKDPMGWKDQEMRTALLQDEHEADDEEGRHVPLHHSIKPTGGILKGGPVDLTPARVSAAAQMTMDPKMQQGVVRVKEYLNGVSKDDVSQLPTILKILQLMQPNSEVATHALVMIFEFTRDAAKGRQIVAQNGGIKEIVNAMAAHADSMTLQMHGCGCLYALSCFRAGSLDKDNNSVDIAHVGGIGRLLFAMDSFPQCPEIQQWGTGALRHLAIEIGDNRREVRQDGEIQLTMRGINRRMITKSGGIELMVKSMVSFPHDLEIQENGCAALCNLMANRHDTKVRAARAGCIRAVISSMRNFPFEPELVQMACAVLRSLALGVPENKVSIVAQDGVRQLCEAMARHRTDADVNMQAIAALCNLTSHFSENKRAICEGGGLEMAVAALLLHPQSQELQQQGCGLLHNLACESSLRPLVLAAGALQVAEAALHHPSRSVQSLAQMLQRQLHTGQDRENTKVEATGPKPSKPQPKAGGVEELFAPRTQGVRVARSRALTRPQRKVMADVMASMRSNPREWLPRDGASASGEDGRESEVSSASGRSGRGKWDIKEQKRAAAYGIADLEGVSDGSHVSGDESGFGTAFAFVVRRGLAKGQGEGHDDATQDTRASRSNSFQMQLELDDEVPMYGANILPLTARNLKAQERIASEASEAAPSWSQKSGAMPVPALDAQSGIDIGTKDPVKDFDAVSASSGASEGGWIDDLEDPRLEKRSKRQRRAATAAPSSGIVDEIFGEVELEQRPQEKRQRPLQRKSSEFARALRKCGEVAPERFDESWEQALSARVLGGRSSSSLLNDLDGLTRIGRVSSNLRQRLGAKSSKSDQKAEVKEDLEEETDGPVHSEPRDGLGQAEVALLDALHLSKKKTIENSGASADAEGSGSRVRSREALRLEALSRQLEQKRAQQRRVHLL